MDRVGNLHFLGLFALIFWSTGSQHLLAGNIPPLSSFWVILARKMTEPDIRFCMVTSQPCMWNYPTLWEPPLSVRVHWREWWVFPCEEWSRNGQIKDNGTENEPTIKMECETEKIQNRWKRLNTKKCTCMQTFRARISVWPSRPSPGSSQQLGAPCEPPCLLPQPGSPMKVAPVSSHEKGHMHLNNGSLIGVKKVALVEEVQMEEGFPLKGHVILILLL